MTSPFQLAEEKIQQLKEDALHREVQNLRIFVVGGGHAYIKMFYDAGFRGATGIDDADIVCFTGGEDVTPSYYGEEPIPGTNFSPRRDAYETEVFANALLENKAMIGICRGGQFLNVMNRGKLWQHINNHAGVQHAVMDLRNNEMIEGMTSTHHQQMIPADDADILAVACRSTIKKSEKETVEREQPETDDVEAVWYKTSKCLCFQPHPEFSHGPCRDYFLSLVDELILTQPSEES